MFLQSKTRKLTDLQSERNYQMTHTRPQAIASIMYKVKNGLVPPYITDLYLLLPVLLLLIDPVIYSKLDRSIRSSELMDTFAKRIKFVNFMSLLDSTCQSVFFYVTTDSCLYCVTRCFLYVKKTEVKLTNLKASYIFAGIKRRENYRAGVS